MRADNQRQAIPAAPAVTCQPRQLWPADVSRLFLEHHSRVDPGQAVALLAESPGSSFWIPETGEFILVVPWRHRPELVAVHTFGAFANEDALLDTAIRHAEAEGRAAFVVVDVNELRKPSFYARHGLQHFEDIITYEHRQPGQFASQPMLPGLEFRPVVGSDPALLRAVQELDHAAFPWFWWNSETEFEIYLDWPGVEVWAGVRGHEVVSYVGITRYRRWSHLDRIASRPDVQGTGVGRTTLAFAMTTMARQGGRRVALSTQGNNTRSRKLYQRTGFRRTPADDYAIFVRPFDEALVFAGSDPGRRA